MVNIYCNHLTITGPEDRLTEFTRWCHINEDMIDVDDGASDVRRFDKAENDANHKGFIDFIESETDTCVDRVRLYRLDDGALQINLDSWGFDLGPHTHWMADNFEDLKFSVTLIEDGHYNTRVIFEGGKWIAIHHRVAQPEHERRWINWVSAIGYYDTYTGRHNGRILDLDSIEDVNLREFAKKYWQAGRADHERAQRRFHERAIRVDEIREHYYEGLATFRLGDAWGLGYIYNLTEEYDTLNRFKDHLPPDHVVPFVLAFDGPDIVVADDGIDPICLGPSGGKWALYNPKGLCVGRFLTKDDAIAEAKRVFRFEEAMRETAG